MIFDYLNWRSNKRQERKLDMLIDPPLPPTDRELAQLNAQRRAAGWVLLACVIISALLGIK